jgi:glycosyltransferase involved in cell wall biosynthesis
LPQTTGKTILFVTNTHEYGGAEKHLLELMRRLVGDGVHLSILCADTDFYTKRLNPNQVEIIVRKSGLKSFWEWFRVFRAIRPDIVVFVRATLWCFEWYVPVAAWLAGIVRRVSIAHLPPPPLAEKIEGNSILRIMSRFRTTRHLVKMRISELCENATICVSNEIRDALIRDYRFPIHKTITIHNGVSLIEFNRHEDKGSPLRKRLGLDPQEFLLLCIARLSEQKRIDILLLAMARLMQEGVLCKCIIVGDGPLRQELSNQAFALGLCGQVFF